MLHRHCIVNYAVLLAAPAVADGATREVLAEDGSGAGAENYTLLTENFSSVTPVDLEFKQLAWGLIAQLCSGPFADQTVRVGVAASSGSAEDGAGPRFPHDDLRVQDAGAPLRVRPISRHRI